MPPRKTKPLPPTLEESEAEVRSWGYTHVYTWTDPPYAPPPPPSFPVPPPQTNTPLHRKSHYPPHSHAVKTTHLVRKGSLTITYPEDKVPFMETFRVGGRVDVEAGRVHEVFFGVEGGEYVVGEM